MKSLRYKLSVGVFVSLVALTPVIPLATFSLEILVPSESGVVQISQGSRLNPGEHTPHVPFIINGTADFDIQGWPGSGTSGDPYVIAGLNITTDHLADCITILETDAYFVIRDCIITHSDYMTGIKLVNTTHATIEYNTIKSRLYGVSCENANNTIVSHNDVFTEAQACVYLFFSDDCTLESNLMNNTQFACLYTIEAHYLTSMYNQYISYDVSAFGMYGITSNYTVSIDDTVVGGDGMGVYFASCHYGSYTGLSVSESGTYGIFAADCTFTNFTSCQASSIDFTGGTFIDSHGVRVIDCEFTDCGEHGVRIETSNDTFVSNSVINNVDEIGLLVDTCHSSDFTMNTISEIGIDGVEIINSEDALLSDLVLDEIGDYGVLLLGSPRPILSYITLTNNVGDGIYADTCANGSISGCSLDGIGGNGMYIGSSGNWEVHDNTFIDASDEAIYVSTSSNCQIYRNTITDAFRGIYTTSSTSPLIANNTISVIENQGIYARTSGDALIADNGLTDCAQGIYVYISDDCTVESNTITDSIDMGIYVYNSDNGMVSDNEMSVLKRGIHVRFAFNFTFTNNFMTDCGFFFDTGYAYTYYNHTFSGNTINGLPFYYNRDIDSLNLDASLYGQFFLLNCSSANIASGTFTRVTCSVHAFYCDEISIENIQSQYNYRGMQVYSSDNATILESSFDGGPEYYGVYVAYSDRLLVENCSFSRHTDTNGNGIFMQSSDLQTIRNCDFDNNWRAVRWSTCDNVTVTGCTILNSENYAIYAWGDNSEYVLIEDNTILNATYGFYSYRASNGLVTDNTIMYCSSVGIYLAGFDGNNYNVTLNTVENNYDGIIAWTSDSHFIMNNTVRWNSNYGINCFGSDFTEVYYNIIALNFDNLDSRSGNNWDDGVGLGNWWDDASPPAVYDIDGDTDDRWPQLYLPTEPIINQPQDISYAEGDTGNTITWIPFDDSLSHWEVEIDGVAFESGAWDFVDITVNIDGLEYGTHTAIITVWDVDQNTVTDTVLIHVFDDTPPTISSESDRVAFEDATGQVAVWTATDAHPDTYSFLIDDVVMSTGSWSSGSVQGNLDGLALGDHIVKMTVFDIDGNSATDTIIVRVVDDDTPPMIDSPPDFNYTQGFTQNFIVWSPSDEYPNSYVVTYNGTTYTEGQWTGAAITVNVDGLIVGNHTFSITVYDGAGLSVSDSVVVIVIPPEGITTAPPPADLTMLIIIAGMGAAIVVVVVIIYFLKQRGGYKP